MDHLQAIDPISQLLEMEKNKSATLLNYMWENGFETISLSLYEKEKENENKKEKETEKDKETEE